MTQVDERRDDVIAIDQLLDALSEAVAGGNAEALRRLLSDDVCAIFSGGATPVRGVGPVMETWKRHLAAWDDVVIDRRDTVVRIHGDVAWAHFLWDGEGTADGHRYRLEGERWTAVMVWEPDGWRFAQTHTSMPYGNWDAHRI